ncbi:casein kinase I-like isoform X2 [Aphidius gifuensis]|uniref:casein kinase I-like isoform X2 n=1 Tax=Aphidius gifuensis TaxID=684658 RepID=UPI001CDB8E33|nr:casein kinase I-like isoform X2 [Aphidius gifuensis]
MLINDKLILQVSRSPSMKMKVEVKFERINASSSLLYREKKIYDTLDGVIGIPSIHWYGQEKDCNVLVMDSLGLSLESLLSWCSGKFSVKTVFMIADQLIQRIECIHRRNIIHRDIHPENIVIGNKPNDNQLFIVNFGLAQEYQKKISHDQYHIYKHIAYSDNVRPTGPVRFSSINTHLKIEHSRRDDLETLGYVLLYLSRGSLPWDNIKAVSNEQKIEKIKEIKMGTSNSTLCEGFPHLLEYLNYAKNLKFDETPDYFYIRSLLRIRFLKLNYKYDWIFDWM